MSAVQAASLLLGDPQARAWPNVPSDDSVLNHIGQTQSTELPAEFRILVWNIHKAEDGTQWQRDFHHLATKSDLLLLQEGHQVQAFNDVLERLPERIWSFVTSFVYKGSNTGVVTGSSATPLRTTWLRSPGREPLVNTPKMTAITEYDLSGHQHNLLVANIHGINFVTNGRFYEHITQVITVMEQHQGPMVFAGDFNTWNSSRMEFLVSRCRSLGLEMVNFETDPRTLPLDHVFYRGLSLKKSEVLAHVNTSDHYPLAVEFTMTPQSSWSINDSSQHSRPNKSKRSRSTL